MTKFCCLPEDQSKAISDSPLGEDVDGIPVEEKLNGFPWLITEEMV